MSGSALRIAMVTTFYPPFNFGGDGIYVQRLAHALARRGHHVEVIHDTDAYRAMSGTTPQIPEATPGNRANEVTVHRLASRVPKLASLAVQQLGFPTVHRRKLKALLADRFDVIHFHNISLVGGPGLWAFGNAIKLHTAHEHWLVCPSHILWRDNREICDKKRCIRCVLRHRRPPQLWRATNAIANQAMHIDAFLMLSKSAAENHRRFGFTSPMTLFPSFLPDEETEIAPQAAPPAPYFLFVGRLEVIKGLQDVIPAFGPDMPAELLIAGSGEYEPELRRLADGKPKVRFLGRMSMPQLRRLYRDAIAVLTPSRCYEVFPLVVLEAFRDATPIVARALGPYPEIIEQTGGGILFETHEELVTAMQCLLDNRQLAAEMGMKGQLAFARRWSEDVAIAEYLKVIGEAADKRGLAELAQRAGTRSQKPTNAH